MAENLELLSSAPVQTLERMIYTVRGVQVMLDSDLAALYKVETKTFNQAVKRNIERFPESFRFQLSVEEYQNLRSQFVTSNKTPQQVPRIPEYWHPRSSLPAARGAWWGGWMGRILQTPA